MKRELCRQQSDGLAVAQFSEGKSYDLFLWERSPLNAVWTVGHDLTASLGFRFCSPEFYLPLVLGRWSRKHIFCFVNSGANMTSDQYQELFYCTIYSEKTSTVHIFFIWLNISLKFYSRFLRSKEIFLLGGITPYSPQLHVEFFYCSLHFLC